MTTFGCLPACFNRSAKAFNTGLWRLGKADAYYAGKSARNLPESERRIRISYAKRYIEPGRSLSRAVVRNGLKCAELVNRIFEMQTITVTRWATNQWMITSSSAMTKAGFIRPSYASDDTGAAAEAMKYAQRCDSYCIFAPASVLQYIPEKLRSK
ncbi:MAG: hypothetical protein LBP52_05740 [Burkholderiaceae bacterium]|jgi:hypothetical protein|nr:hypothetical protein [Burkholderiaceae bacterium]